jgi:hypothetical protein
MQRVVGLVPAPQAWQRCLPQVATAYLYVVKGGTYWWLDCCGLSWRHSYLFECLFQARRLVLAASALPKPRGRRGQQQAACYHTRARPRQRACQAACWRGRGSCRLLDPRT